MKEYDTTVRYLTGSLKKFDINFMRLNELLRIKNDKIKSFAEADDSEKSKIVEETKKFQKSMKVDSDGIVGPMTLTRLLTREEENGGDSTEYEYELLNQDGLKFKINTSFLKDGNYGVRDRSIKRIVTHWDACLNADACIKVLLKREVSTHFVIDNDGTIIQLLPVNVQAYHAAGHNANSIGIDLSNAYYTKYSEWYKKNVGIERPVIKSKVHHSTTTHLGYYPSQIDSYKKLCLHLCKKYGIKVKVPLDKSGSLITTVIKEPENWEGIMCHYHLTTRKIDCQGLKLDEIFKNEEK